MAVPQSLALVPGVGLMPKVCLGEVPRGTVIEDLRNGTILQKHPSFEGGKKLIENIPELCAKWIENRHMLSFGAANDNMASQPEQATSLAQQAGFPSGYQCTQYTPANSSFGNFNGWWATAGWYIPDDVPGIGGMSSIYQVPATPEIDSVGQTLFYFIGAENTHHDEGFLACGASGGPTRNFTNGVIVQPVLAYDPGCKEDDPDCPATDPWCNGTTGVSETGWCLASWYCCAQGTAWFSPWDQDIEPGDLLYGYFNISTDGSLMEVSSTNLRTNATTSLSAPVQDRVWDWADVTLETYQISDCGALSPGNMTYSNITLWDTNYQPLTPEWWFNPITTGPDVAGYPGYPNPDQTYNKQCGVNVVSADAKDETMMVLGAVAATDGRHVANLRAIGPGIGRELEVVSPWAALVIGFVSLVPPASRRLGSSDVATPHPGTYRRLASSTKVTLIVTLSAGPQNCSNCSVAIYDTASCTLEDIEAATTLYNSSEFQESPWRDIVYNTDENGQAVLEIDIDHLISFDDYLDKAVVIDGNQGRPYACGVFSVDDPATTCGESGGTVTTEDCSCRATGNFPNTCDVGACGCPPGGDPNEISVCECPPSTCFDGIECYAVDAPTDVPVDDPTDAPMDAPTDAPTSGATALKQVFFKVLIVTFTVAGAVLVSL